MPKPSSEALSVEELSALSCESCNCDDPDCGLLLSSRCHPRAGARVKFFKSTRLLQVVCDRCDALIMKIQLGPAPN